MWFVLYFAKLALMLAGHTVAEGYSRNINVKSCWVDFIDMDNIDKTHSASGWAVYNENKIHFSSKVKSAECTANIHNGQCCLDYTNKTKKNRECSTVGMEKQN